MLNIVIFGAPGSGKGTQSDNLIKTYGLFHISTGDVLRDNIKRGTELGATAKAYMDKGQLIPDDLMISILADVLDANRESTASHAPSRRPRPSTPCSLSEAPPSAPSSAWKCPKRNSSSASCYAANSPDAATTTWRP